MFQKDVINHKWKFWCFIITHQSFTKGIPGRENDTATLVITVLGPGSK